jgi:hypothetical protein
MAYKSVNQYNGKVLRTFDDITDLDKALWMALHIPRFALLPPTTCVAYDRAAR